ncbi:MAG: LamG domain-containing protein, partial [Cyclobacteriaceae bacterium]
MRLYYFRLAISLSIFFLCNTAGFSQFIDETDCSNGIDDGGDGFTDCYDSECAGGASCTDFYFGNSVVCADEPDPDPQFNMKTEWASQDETANSHALPAVGDINQDGTPEVVVTNRQAKTVAVLDGVTGATEFVITLDFEPENALVLASLEGDGCAEIIVVENRGSHISVYDCQENLRWSTITAGGNVTNLAAASGGADIGLPAVADFNGDGSVELYYKNEIRNALTGDIVVSGSGDWEFDFVHSPAAVDIDGDGDLELITGNMIWNVDIAGGSLSKYADMNDVIAADATLSGSYYPKAIASGAQWTSISVADIDSDNHLDIITSGALGSDNTGTATIFYWNVDKAFVKIYQDAANDYEKGTGRINIGDVNDDGELNLTYVSNELLYSLEIDAVTGDLDPIWTKGIEETSSGFTGCTLFDFNGDGASEILYRSEKSLLIIDGKNGDTKKELACVSQTQEEYPLVADVDGDGASEICVTCYTSNGTPTTPYSNTRYSQVRVFGADGEAWQPSRSVWNQHAYFNVNVNDDLTIPSSQQDHSRVFSTDICTDGENRFLNTFLSQAPFVEGDGCPSYVSPDIELDGSSITASAANCPETEFETTFTISNVGDADLSGTLPVTFYAGDPTLPGSIKLNTEVEVLNNFLKTETRTITMDVDGIGGNFDLYVSVNDFGQTPPITPIAASITECDLDNNIETFSVAYNSFQLTADSLKANVKCDDSKPDNGIGTAYFNGTVGGTEETFWFEDFSDPALNGLQVDNGDTPWSSSASGTPSFYGVINGSFKVWNTGGSNEDDPVNWTTTIDISDYSDVSFSLDLIAQGPMQESGTWRDVVRVYYELDNGGEIALTSAPGNFGYTQRSVSNLNGNSLTIRVQMHSTDDAEIYTLDNVSLTGTSAPVTKTFTDVDGFEFYWYDFEDFDQVLHTGSTYSSMAAGDFSVVGYAANGSCFSDTVTVTIRPDNTPLFEVEVYELQPLTNCSLPDGQLRAFAYTSEIGGIPQDTLYDGYSFNWTLSSDAGGTTIGTGDTLSNLEALGYFVEVTNNLTGCTVTGLSDISTALSKPATPSINISNITSCGGTGEAEAVVSGNANQYSFEWFFGSGMKPTPDRTTQTIEDLPEGDYTLRVIRNNSGCASETVTGTVADVSTGPKPNATVSQHNSACGSGAYNGIVTTDGDGAGGVSGFSYQWHVGTTTSNATKLPGAIDGAAELGSGETITGLPDGIYTVAVKKGGCTINKTVEVLEVSDAPEYNFITSVNAGNAINFSGQSWLEIPQAVHGWQEITLSYWTYLSLENYADDHLIFSSGGTGEDQLALWTDDTDGLSFVIKAQGTADIGRITTNYKPTGWTQLTGVWSAITDLNGDGILGDMAIYADGVLIGTDNYLGGTNKIDAPQNEMWVARGSNLGVNKFTGRIDEIRIFNKAFTPTEINAAVCEETTGSEEGLIVYYDFDGLSDLSDGANMPNRASEINANTDTNTGESGSFYDGTLQRQGQGTFSYLTSNINCPLGYAENNTTCDDSNPNGKMDLTGKVDPDDGSRNYKYVLYEGYSTDSPKDSIYTPDAPVFDGLPSGFYTIETIDTDTECSTGTLAFAIANIPDTPTIVATVTDDQGCNTTGTGSIKIVSYSDNVEPADGYTYELFNGANFTPANSLGTISIADGSIGHTFTGLTDGTYRIQVTNETEQCDAYEDLIIGDISTIPTIGSITLINDSNCETGAGVMNVNMPGNTDGDYTYSFYYGGTVLNDSLIVADTVASDLSGLEAGQYTVVAKDKITGCETLSATRTITYEPYVPNVFTVEVTAASGCNNTAGGGSIRAYVDLDGSEVVSGYSFQWYVGPVSDGIMVDVANNGDQSTAINLPSETYYVMVTDNTNKCTSVTGSITLSSSPIKPILAESSKSPNTGCNADTYDGSATLSTSFDGSNVANAGDSGYDFDWFYSNGTEVVNGGTVSNADKENPSGLVNDSYKVVTTGPNGCTSDTLVVNITHVPNRPKMTVVQEEPTTGCNIGNGKALADGDGAGGTLGYTFEWFLGNNTQAANSLPGTANPNAFYINDETYNLGGLDAGIYTVRVTNNTNECDTTQTVTISDDSEDPLVIDVNDIVITAATSCDTLNPGGKVDISSIVSTAQSVQINNINGSFEEPNILTATNASESFNGNRIRQFRQSDISGWSTTESDAIPEIEIFHKTNTVRNHDAYEGDQWAEINADQDAALYFDLNTQPGVEMIWRFAHRARGTGNETLALFIGPSTGTLVEITRATSDRNQWYLYEGTYTVPEGQYFTRFQYQAITGGSTGNFVDGVEFFMSPYNYSGFLSSNTTGNAVEINEEGVFDSLAADTYTFYATDNYTGCTTDPINVIVEDDTPEVLAVASSKLNNTVCDPNNNGGNPDFNGGITFNPTTDGVVASSYSFQLATSGSIDIDAAGGNGGDYSGVSYSTTGTQSVVDGLPAGNYVMTVTDFDVKCDTTYSFTIIDDFTHKRVVTLCNISITDNNTC